MHLAFPVIYLYSILPGSLLVLFHLKCYTLAAVKSGILFTSLDKPRDPQDSNLQLHKSHGKILSKTSTGRIHKGKELSRMCWWMLGGPPEQVSLVQGVEQGRAGGGQNRKGWEDQAWEGVDLAAKPPSQTWSTCSGQ